MSRTMNLAVASAIVVFTVVAPVAPANAVIANNIDQCSPYSSAEQTLSSNTGASSEMPFSQSFTAGLTGDMNSVSVSLHPMNPSGTVTADVDITAAGLDDLPTGLVLASGTASHLITTAEGAADHFDITFNLAVPLAVTTGTKYVATFNNFTPDEGWFRSGQTKNWYTRGDIGQSWSGWLHQLVGYDTYFRTNVTADVPNPLTACTVAAMNERDNPGSGSGSGSGGAPSLEKTGFDAAPFAWIGGLTLALGFFLRRRRML